MALLGRSLPFGARLAHSNTDPLSRSGQKHFGEVLSG
jgi:hypothetical protein